MYDTNKRTILSNYEEISNKKRNTHKIMYGADRSDTRFSIRMKFMNGKRSHLFLNWREEIYNNNNNNNNRRRKKNQSNAPFVSLCVRVERNIKAGCGARLVIMGNMSLDEMANINSIERETCFTFLPADWRKWVHNMPHAWTSHVVQQTRT